MCGCAFIPDKPLLPEPIAGVDAVGSLYALLLGDAAVPSYLRVAAFALLRSPAVLPMAVTIPGWTPDLQTPHEDEQAADAVADEVRRDCAS
jgi:hypothetical protein